MPKRLWPSQVRMSTTTHREHEGCLLTWIIDDATDVYWLAQAYYDSNQYERALDLLNKKKTLNKSVHCRYLAGLCAVSDSTIHVLPINDDPLTISRMLLKIGGMHWIIWALKILLLIKVGLHIVQSLCG